MIRVIENISKAWCKSTCYSPVKEGWTKSNPSFGQCAVTALLVHDLIGGKIYYNKELHHYYNITDSGGLIDLTNKQFGCGVCYTHDLEADVESLLHGEASEKAKTRKRYEKLKKRFEKYMEVTNENKEN